MPLQSRGEKRARFIRSLMMIYCQSGRTVIAPTRRDPVPQWICSTSFLQSKTTSARKCVAPGPLLMDGDAKTIVRRAVTLTSVIHRSGDATYSDHALERFPFALAHGTRSSSLFESVIHRSGDSTCADHALAGPERFPSMAMPRPSTPQWRSWQCLVPQKHWMTRHDPTL